jgi:alanyl-tRNA synthetase
LRFDFQAPRALTADEINQINTNINQLVAQSHLVTIQEMAYPDAIKLGAKAFFEDKYGDIVRVVQVINKQTQSPTYLSIELCGGTHVSYTSEI